MMMKANNIVMDDDDDEDLSSQDSYEVSHTRQQQQQLSSSSYPSSLGPKKRKYNEEERIRRCRERNRVHARNTRERKKMQLDLLEYRIQELIDERIKLKCTDADTSVASILMSLAGVQTMKSVQREEDAAALLLSSSSAVTAEGEHEAEEALASESPLSGHVAAVDLPNGLVTTPRNGGAGVPSTTNTTTTAAAAAIAHQTATSLFARSYTDSTIEKIRQEVANILSGDDSLEMDSELLHKDKSNCTSGELDMIRRERNRMHAKRTRLRKKKMLQELEAIVSQLETEIKQLYKEKGIAPQAIVDRAMMTTTSSTNPSSHEYRELMGSLASPSHDTFASSRHRASSRSGDSSGSASGSASGDGSGSDSPHREIMMMSEKKAKSDHGDIDSSIDAIDLLVATAQYGTLTRSHLNDHDMKSTRSNQLIGKSTDMKSSHQPSHGSDMNIRHLTSTESHTTHAYSSSSGSCSSDFHHTTQNHHHNDSSGGSSSGSGDGGSSNSEEEASATGSTSESESATRVRVDRQSVKPSRVLSAVSTHRDRCASASQVRSDDY